MKKRMNNMIFSIIELIWIYFSLVPMLIIVCLSFVTPVQPFSKFLRINVSILIVLLFLLLTLWGMTRYIKRRFKNNRRMSLVGNIEKAKNNKEYMAFNFFAIYLLPVLSIDLNNRLSLIVVLILILMISYKANLFYYNILLFLFYDYERVIISNETYFIISKRGSSPIQKQEYLYLIDEKVKLYIRQVNNK